MLKKNTNSRSANIDILRLVAMFFIVVSHYVIYNSISSSELPLGINKLVFQLSDLGGIGVTIFVVISGYLLCESTFKLRRIISLELQALFYSVVFFVIFVALGKKSLSLENVVNNIFSFSTNNYWFITTYIVFSFFVPFINRMINGLSQKSFLIFLSILSFFVAVLPLITFNKFPAYSNFGGLGQFLTYYCFGAYMRKHPNSLLKKYRYWICASMVIILITSVVVFDLIGFAEHSSYLYVRGSIIVVCLAASLVEIAVESKPIISKFISTLGVSTLGVYFIHEHPFVRDYLWTELFDNSAYDNSARILLHFFISCVIVFVGCLVIDCVRNLFLGRFEFTVSNKLSNVITTLFNHIKEKLF